MHAVQQPLDAPEIRSISADRPPDATYADITNDLRIHSRTTARLDLSATWTDITDPVPIVTYPPPSLTRHIALRELERERRSWRIAGLLPISSP